MMLGDSRHVMEFNNETLKGLLEMNEGPALDFKQEQYRFDKASDKEKSELLKDILAFANSQRYRVAYILIGVKEEKGGSRKEVVGVEDHLGDANLHQFVSSKTNKPVEFCYSQFPVEDKQIGVLSIPIQTRPVYAVRRYGRVEANTVYMRDGSSTRPAFPDDVADMGRAQTPELLEWFVRRIQNLAMHATVVTAQQWFDNSVRELGYESMKRPQDYTKARDVILKLTESRPIEPATFSKGVHSYRSLRWVFSAFEELAGQCTQSIRTTGPSFMEFGALTRAILEMEERIEVEKKVWDEFRIRMTNEDEILPNPANYNILGLARQAVHFVEILEDKEHYRNPDYDTRNRFPQVTILRSPEWGEWRR